MEWDWDVELVGDAAVLALYPGGRGHDRGVILTDGGDGYSPIRSWDRRVNSEDYASVVIVTGTGNPVGPVSATAGDMTNDIPRGVRDYREEDGTIATAERAFAKADQILRDRSVVKSSWQVDLMPGFWRGRSHIDLGDTIRLVVNMGAETLDEKWTVETIAVDVDATGVERVSLTLGWPRPDPNPRSRRSVTSKLITKIVNRLS
jgi:hypothetical protein